MPRKKSLPTYCLHSRSGNAYTTIDGRQVQLGRHGTPESKKALDRLLAEYLQLSCVEPIQRPGDGDSQPQEFVQRLYPQGPMQIYRSETSGESLNSVQERP